MFPQTRDRLYNKTISDSTIRYINAQITEEKWLDNLLWWVNYPNLRHGSKVILTGQDIYLTQGTRAGPALEQTRAEKPCRTRKDFDRASMLDLWGGLLIGREALQPSEPHNSLDKAMPSYYTKNGSFTRGIFKMWCVLSFSPLERYLQGSKEGLPSWLSQ
jgi:hypothetical protein